MNENSSVPQTFFFRDTLVREAFRAVHNRVEIRRTNFDHILSLVGKMTSTIKMVID